MLYKLLRIRHKRRRIFVWSTTRWSGLCEDPAPPGACARSAPRTWFRSTASASVEGRVPRSSCSRALVSAPLSLAVGAVESTSQPTQAPVERAPVLRVMDDRMTRRFRRKPTVWIPDAEYTGDWKLTRPTDVEYIYCETAKTGWSSVSLIYARLLATRSLCKPIMPTLPTEENFCLCGGSVPRSSCSRALVSVAVPVRDVPLSIDSTSQPTQAPVERAPVLRVMDDRMSRRFRRNPQYGFRMRNTLAIEN